MHTETATTHETSSQPSNTDTIYNSVPTAANEPVVSTQGSFDNGARTVQFNAGDFAKYQAWLADSKRRNVNDILQGMKGVAGTRRQTMILRRAKPLNLAPDEDVAAYQRVYELKNPSGDPKNKTFVSDNEIKAYKVLDPRFDSVPSLTTIAAMVEELKATGQLTNEGDVTEEE